LADVHLPHLHEDEHSERHGQKRSLAHHPAVKLVLEVVLISAGVFLGLMGEQWRENVHHRELADAALRRFHTEIAANRREIARVKDYHATKLGELNAYFGAPPAKRDSNTVSLQGIQIAQFERTAWDLAIATNALEYIDPDVSFALSRVYTQQQLFADLTHGLSQAMYVVNPSENLGAFLGAVQIYYSDATVFEPKLVGLYDNVLPQINRALGESDPEPIAK
jgi:hypothetical protein